MVDLGRSTDAMAELYPEPATEPRGINLRVPPSAEHLRPTLREGCHRSYPLPNCGRRPLAPRPLRPLAPDRRCSVDLGPAAPLNSINPEGSQALVVPLFANSDVVPSTSKGCISSWPAPILSANGSLT